VAKPAASPLEAGGCDLPMSDRPRRTTAADVAARAGCSTAAVSLYLNGKSHGRLSQSWVDRIADAVQVLNYVPNRTAQQLVLGSSKSVAFIFPGPHYALLGFVVDGVSRSLGPDWDLSFFHARGPSGQGAPTDTVRRALASHPGALLLASPPQEWIEAAESFSVPTVMIDSVAAPPGISSVEFDFAAGITAMATDLAEHGHRQVGYVSYEAESASIAARRTLVERGLHHAGLALGAADLHVGDASLTVLGEQFADLWPTWRAAGVTAVVCADDRHAWGVLTGARELGLHVPEDLSVVGFNDLEPAALLRPALSSIALPAREIGEAAGRLLVDTTGSKRVDRYTVTSAYRSRESVGHARRD
jgi:LacI family transcriptional regulator